MVINKRKTAVWAAVLAAGVGVVVTAYALAGDLLPRSLNPTALDFPSVEPNVAEHAFVKYLRYYVPAQSADGTTPVTIEYTTGGGTVAKTRTEAKPQISAFMYGPAYAPDETNAGGYVGHGRRDIYGALSLDDGTTWKKYNLSESADLSSIEVSTSLKDPADQTKTITAFPGDAVNVAMAVADKKVVVAWPSRYCSGGSPAYAMDDTTREAIASHLGINLGSDLYLTDLFGVNGDQGSHDYTADGLPLVGEVPYNCLWTARGVMVEGDDPRTTPAVEANHIVWYKAERLTSGRRDVNRVEIDMVKDAGAVIVWQEDPDGLRPGDGEGPGEGWSGATAASQTDIWYSFLPYAHFETVNSSETPVPLTGTGGYWPTTTTKPQPYVPFAVPMRLSNNAKCLAAGGSSPYCYGTTASPYGLADQCASTVNIPKGQGNQTQDICVSAGGLPNVANTAAVRPRVSLRPKLDSGGNTVGAWVVVIAEEDKGLGNFAVDTNNPGVISDCDPDASQTDSCVKFDEGKNIWYYSFDMGSPQTSADTSATSLVKNLVSQGNMVNQPEVDWRTGDALPAISTAEMWDFGQFNFQLYRTEIARRGSLMVQAPANVSQGNSKLMAMLLFKQGLINQGGPADIMARRIVDAGKSTNPYDFSNLVCGSAAFADGSNPYYPKGICLEPAINLSGTTPQSCAVSGSSSGDCPTIDGDGAASVDPTDQTLFDKVETWIQCPGSPECGNNALSTALGSNLNDQSWYNPLDVAKGHRGYIWGDMAVVMYAWSPNWKFNAVGNDRYELYIRRSFDGGKTWTTTPASWGGLGTRTCETMRDGATAADDNEVCVDYAAGAPEQARNVSQLKSKDGTGTYKFTILDPRYAPDPPTMPTIDVTGDAAALDNDTDVFNPSRFMIVYEVGDNTTTVDGEPEALDLYYGRGVNFGDQYQVTSEESTMAAACVTTFCNEFAQLTTGAGVSAEEASLAMTPAGDSLYAVWAQSQAGTHEARYARVWYTDANFTPSTPPLPATDDNVIGDTTPTSTSSGGGGGCAMTNGQAPFDPTLPALAALGLIGLGLRRVRTVRRH